MHPELSRFPREHIYDDGALLDPPDMASRRAWPDPLWPARALWIEVHGRADGTRNDREASAILRQLGRFRSWARTHQRADGRPWEIAMLTFYRAQEKLLRHALRDSLKQPGAFDRFTLGTGDAPQALIDLCTVDRFQGHEADLVMLSFARTHGVGFLDSPNRLNVALTRARYQLLLVGRRQNFLQQRRSELLQLLAGLPATYELQD
jgi:superfamily I DNA and/or RNA helicase